MKTKILILVDGGVVQEVFACGGADLDVVVQDYDDQEAEGLIGAAADQAIWFEDGQTVERFLQQVQLENPNYRALL